MIGRRRGSLVPGVGLAAAALGAVVAGAPWVNGSLRAVIANVTDSAASGLYSCTSVAVNAGAYSTWPLNDALLSLPLDQANDVSGNNHPGTYSLLGVTRQSAGPCPRDSGLAATFDGATGYVYNPTAVAIATTTPSTLEVWFKTTTTAGGLLMAAYSAVPGAGGGAGRVDYMTPAGQVTFATTNGTAVQAVQSPLAYNDGKWHLADGVFSASAGSALYVDGTLVASNAAYNLTTAFSSYTRLAYGQLSGFPSAGSGGWAGSLAYASTYYAALSAAQVGSHYAAGD